MMRAITLSVAVLLLASDAASGQPAPVKPDVGIEQHLNDSVPLDLPFRNERGDTVTLGQYFGARPVMLVLAYSRCPRLCNVSLSNLASSLGKIDYQAGREFDVVIVSIDPRETPTMASARKAALLDNGAAPGWHFLTGDEPAIQRLAASVGFRYSYDAEHDLYAHASAVILLTAEGRIARYYFGVDYAPRDLRFGLEDASAGAIGSPLTQPLRLLCFSYDPDAGAYTLMTMRLVKVGSAITVLLLALFLVRAWRREPRSA